MTESQPKSEANHIDEAGRDFHVVGVGASAGGLEALELFFEKMPVDTGMAFVVVQHLSPDFKSHMDQLLSRKTKLPVRKVEEGLQVEKNTIYLIPAKKEMVISEGRLLLKERGTELSHPIDQFFRSLAHDVGRYAIGVILSGTGSDGSRGIRDIASANGLVLCQDEVSAKFDGMPLNAQATGCVHVVLRPDAMPDALVRYINEGVGRDSLAEHESIAHTTGIEKIFTALRAHCGLDFSHYKANTIGRRIQRRMEMEKCSTIEAYTQRLEEDEGELTALYQDLLIGVTRFFRDRQAYHILREDVIPGLLDKHADGLIRIWVAGCATGEEAYSIAILLEEEIRARNLRVDYKLFATDAHPLSLKHAANGVYAADVVEGMDADLLSRYFRKTKDNFKVIRELRQKIVFAPHNVFNDPPFTQVNLVSCRNLLIYLQPNAQKKTLTMFHFALKTGGILFLGPSETPGDLSDEFQPIDKRWRLYRKRRDIRLPIDSRIALGNTNEMNRLFGSHKQATSQNPDLSRTYELLLAESMSTSLLVDENFNLLHVFGGAERFLSHRSGRHSSNLLDTIHESLRTSIAGGLQHALKDNTEVKYAGVRQVPGEKPEQIRLTIRPIHDRTAGAVALLVKFDPLARQASSDEDSGDAAIVDLSEVSEKRIESLEGELRYTRENLQATIEELETANEELQATNEEMVASNEELQSTNEELQSVNEELYTVNVEHQKRIAELAEANNDMDNLLATTRVGVIFVDEESCLRRFTPEIGRMFHMMPQDIGRPIASFASNLGYEGLVEDVGEALREEKEIERDITDRANTPYLLRILPYRDASGVSGAVLTIIDVTRLVEAQRQIKRFKHLSDTAKDIHLILDEEGRILYANPQAIETTGIVEEKVFSSRVFDIDENMDPVRFKRLVQQLKAGGSELFETEIRTPSGTVPLEVGLSGIEIAGERFVFGVGRDITNRKLQNEHLVEARLKAEAASQAKSEFLANMSHEIRTPLSAVLGYAELIERMTENSEVSAHAQTVRRNGQHLLSIINDILDLSKIEARKLAIDFMTVDPASIVNDIHEMMQVRSSETGVRFVVEFLGPMPQKVRTDPVRLRQILVNLCGNAMKFTEAGEVRLEVSFANDKLTLSVVDTGIGMTDDEMSVLFQPFTRTDKSATRGGTGLGLSISKRLVDLLGGTIGVESEKGVGSRFTVMLPTRLEPDGKMIQPQISSVETPPQQELSSLKRKHILVADDRRDIWKIASHFLEQAGATVAIASNGQEAIDAVRDSREQPFDAIVMDMQMPVKTGCEAVSEIRELGFMMPIIALTAAAMKGEREEALNAGCDAYLTKPIDAALLTRTIADLVTKE